MNYKDKVVVKPWGYEYLAYENKDVAVWYLHINQGESTSMHCHPKKTTGLILLNGEAEVSFLADKRVMKGLDKVMIRRGLFHQTKALSNGGIDVFEIETPNDKEDLVRLSDNYGRQDKPYETTYQDRSMDCVWFPDWSQVHLNKTFKDCTIDIFKVNDNTLKDNEVIDDTDLVIFLKGGLRREVNGKSLCALIPGDVGFFSIVKQVALQLDGVMNDTVIMTISK